MAYQLGYSASQLHATWTVMEELVRDGLVRAIGLSNIGVRRLQRLLGNPALRVPPSRAQRRRHAQRGGRQAEEGQPYRRFHGRRGTSGSALMCQ